MSFFGDSDKMKFVVFLFVSSEPVWFLPLQHSKVESA
jgi:hypothetical protein